MYACLWLSPYLLSCCLLPLSLRMPCLSLVSRSCISGALPKHPNTPPRRPTTDGASCTMRGRRGFDRMARHTHAPLVQLVSTATGLPSRRSCAAVQRSKQYFDSVISFFVVQTFGFLDVRCRFSMHSRTWGHVLVSLCVWFRLEVSVQGN
jgi:hypothetical protein